MASINSGDISNLRLLTKRMFFLYNLGVPINHKYSLVISELSEILNIDHSKTEDVTKEENKQDFIRDEIFFVKISSIKSYYNKNGIKLFHLYEYSHRDLKNEWKKEDIVIVDMKKGNVQNLLYAVYKNMNQEKHYIYTLNIFMELILRKKGVNYVTLDIRIPQF